MISIKKKNEAFEMLKKYEGENPYILRMKKDVFISSFPQPLTDFQAEYVLKNYDKKPKKVNKIVKIADWLGERKQIDWDTDFIPQKIKIETYLGETNTMYHCYVKYRQSVPASPMFLPKNGILTNFLIEDYKNVNVDFDRYTKLSKSVGACRELLEHQKESIKFLLSRKKCILADDPGLGKTTSATVAAIEGNFDSVLIICPASLKENWERELKCFINEKDITIIESIKDKTKPELEEFLGYAIGKSNMTKAELLEEAEKVGQWKHNRFVIVNYDIVDRFFANKKTYTQAQFDKLVEDNPMLQYLNNRKSLIIIDEAHVLSDYKSIRYKTIKSLINKAHPESIYLLTGTPITNNPANLYCVLDLLGDNITNDWNFYMKRYCGAEEFVKDKAERTKWTNEFLKLRHKSSWYDLTKGEKEALNDYLHQPGHCKFYLAAKEPTNLEELKEKISHIYIRHIKDAIKLPEKTIHEVYYALTPSQQDEYEELWNKYEEAKRESAEENEDLNLNKSLLEGAVYRQYLSKEMLPKTEKLVDNFIANNEKVVIACCYDEELYALQEYYGDKCVIYNGKMSLKQKETAIFNFTNDDNIMVFIGNIKAAGVGITLIKSHILVFNDFDYVPGNNSQMSDRIHRIGQKDDCHIYYQIFKNTQYEKMWNINLRKQLTIDTVIKKEEDK